MSRHTRGFATVLLLIACGLAGGALYLQREGALFAPPSAPIPPMEGTAAAETPVVLDIPVPDVSAFEEVVERPLFSETRLPPDLPIVPAGEAAARSPNPFTLMGVAIAGTERLAILHARRTGAVLRVAEGDEIDGWTVARIEPRLVVMVSDGREEEVPMQEISDRPRRPATRAVPAGRSPNGAEADPQIDRGAPEKGNKNE